MTVLVRMFVKLQSQDEGVLLSALLEGVNKVSFFGGVCGDFADLTTRQEWSGDAFSLDEVQSLLSSLESENRVMVHEDTVYMIAQ